MRKQSMLETGPQFMRPFFVRYPDKAFTQAAADHVLYLPNGGLSARPRNTSKGD